MKRLIFQVYVGKPSKLYDFCVNSVKNYCKLHNFDHHILKFPKLRIKPDPFMTGRSKEATERLGYLPIYEKENAFEFFPEYDQIAIIDSDVFIRENSPNVFESLGTKHDFGGVVEREMPITDQYRSKILNYSHMQYANLRDVDWKWDNNYGGEFFNMGIMILNKSIHNYLKGQTPLQFIRRPEFKRFVDGEGNWKWSTDQTLLNYWMKKEKINVKHLSWKWNGLFTANTKIKDCYFVHFFLKDKLPERGENVNQLMEMIK